MAVSLSAADLPQLEPHLEPLRPWLEKTWKGQQKNSKSEKVATDVVHWERALNGNAVRIAHSIDDGAYGGEAIAMWDQKAQSIVYHYFTTDTFNTAGTMTFKDGKSSRMTWSKEMPVASLKLVRRSRWTETVHITREPNF